MSNERKKLEQRLQRKIEQKKREKQTRAGNKQSYNFDNSDVSQSFASSSSKAKNHLKEWMRDLELEMDQVNSDGNGYSKAANNDKFVELQILGNEDEKQLQQVRNKIHEQQKQIDQYKYKLLELTSEHQQLHSQKQQKCQQVQKKSEEVTKSYKQQFEELKKHYEQKIDKYLQQIDTLLQQKAQFNQQCQIFITQDNKMTKILRDLQDRYKKDIKNARQAFVVLEKQKRDKWEQTRIVSMKEEATVRLEPKLQAIIKDSNNQIKKANSDWQQKHNNFTKQYTLEINKKLQQIKQSSFAESEKEKQVLRAEQRKKLKENYERLQLEFEEDRTKMRRMYKEQILQLEKKRREEVEQFLNANKMTQEQHLASVKKIREDYENKIRSMKENVRQRVSQQITRIQKLYQKKLEDAQTLILQQNQQKFNKAKQKIDEAMAQRQSQAKQKLKGEAVNLGRDIQAKYEKKIMKNRKQLEDEKQKLRSKLKQSEQRMLNLEIAQKKSSSDITAYQKQSLKMEKRNEDLSLKIKQKQDEITRIREGIAQKNMQYEQNIKILQQKKRKQYEQIDRLIGRRREEKEKIEQEWLQRYTKIDDENLVRLQKLKGYKNEQIKKQTQTCKQLLKDLQEVKEENRKIGEQLQMYRQKIKMARK